MFVLHERWVLASSCLPKQIFNFSSNLLTHFEKTAKEFALVAQTHKKYSQKLQIIYDGSFCKYKLTKWAISFVT